jgi:hypothetical protein
VHACPGQGNFSARITALEIMAANAYNDRGQINATVAVRQRMVLFISS